MIGEGVLASTANISGYGKHDMKRSLSYITDMRGYLAYVVDDPEPDYVETYPHLYNLSAPAVVPEMDNDAMLEYLGIIEAARDEMVSSQSSRRAVGLISFDLERQIAYLDKAQKFLEDYAQKLLPIDLPKTSPRNPITGAGKTGV